MASAGARVKGALRPRLRAALARGLDRTGLGPERDLLWKRFRRLDDTAGTHSRAYMERRLDIVVGRMTYGAFLVDGSISPGTRIGAFCSFAPGVRIGGPQHPLGFVSTHPFTYLANRGYVAEDDTALQASLTGSVTIEDDVWIGGNAVVLPGVRIGRGAVVAAGAVVTVDVEPYTIVAGVPARPLRRRLDDEQIRALEAIDWPSWDDERLRAAAADFRDVDVFIARYGTA